MEFGHQCVYLFLSFFPIDGFIHSVVVNTHGETLSPHRTDFLLGIGREAQFLLCSCDRSYLQLPKEILDDHCGSDEVHAVKFLLKAYLLILCERLIFVKTI